MPTTKPSEPAANFTVGGVPEHVSLPWYTAIESGRLDDVDWIDQPSGTGAMVAALADGTLDVAVALTEGMVAGVTAGLDARIIGVAIPSPLQWGVHVATGSELETKADLVGTRAAISRRGSGSHLMTYVMADELDWSLDADADFVEIGDMDGARAALAAGDAEFFLWDRFMTQPVVDAGEFRRVGVQPTPWPAFVVAARRDVIDEQGPRLARVLATVADEAASLAARPDLVTLIAERFGLEPDTVAGWVSVTDWAPRDAHLDPGTLAGVQQTLERLGRIDEILEPGRILATLPSTDAD